MRRLYTLTFCSVMLAALIFFFKQREHTTITTGDGLVIPKAWLSVNKYPRTPKADIRPADQTFLTYPEWFLVFSPEEQANYFKNKTATSFPFMQHTRQIWEGYKTVNDQIKNDFPTNKGYHFMIWVIGSSASVEYSIKAWYETIIGRITDTNEPLTDEDKFNAKFTEQYVAFIKDRPWYEFNFKDQLKELWTIAPFSGDHVIRKLDRRYILTSELVVKYLYGKLIGLGTKQVYEEALPTTVVVLNNDSLKYLPRYDKFAQTATDLAKQGYSFKEIAGNTSAILVTAIIPANDNVVLDDARTIFTQPITSDPKWKRIAVAVPVNQLNSLLLQFDKEKIKTEHVFDY